MLELINLLSYTFIMSITPGPNNVICLTQGTKFGFKESIPYTYGITIGCLSQQWLILLIGNLVGDLLPTATTIAGILGAIYMVYLAIKIFRSSGNIGDGKIGDKPLGLKEGILLQYANPKAYIFNTTVISSFILPLQLTILQNLLLSITTGIIFLLCTNAWVLFGQAFTQLFTKHGKLVSFTLSGTLIYLAISIVLH